jgi:hypothetical protein
VTRGEVRRLHTDDVVLKVDGHKVTQDDVTKYVRGSNKLGTPVTLTVRRAATGVTEDVVCLRAPSSFVEHTKDLYLLLEQSRHGAGFSGGTSALVDKIEILLSQLETNHLALQDHLRKHVRGLEMELEELLLACQDMIDREHVSHKDAHGDAPGAQVAEERVGALERELMNATAEAERLRGKVAQLERERQNFAEEEELRAKVKTLEKQLLFLGRSGAEENLHAKVRSLEEVIQAKDAAHERELDEARRKVISDSTQQEKVTAKLQIEIADAGKKINDLEVELQASERSLRTAETRLRAAEEKLLSAERRPPATSKDASQTLPEATDDIMALIRELRAKHTPQKVKSHSGNQSTVGVVVEGLEISAIVPVTPAPPPPLSLSLSLSLARARALSHSGFSDTSIEPFNCFRNEIQIRGRSS